GPGQQSLAAEAVQRLRVLRHPGLLPLDLVTREPGRVIVVTDAVGRSLRERFQECAAQRQSGLPRRELLGYLAEAAATMDRLWQQQALPHGGLHPRCILLKGKSTLLTDYGIAPALWLPTG